MQCAVCSVCVCVCDGRVYAYSTGGGCKVVHVWPECVQYLCVPGAALSMAECPSPTLQRPRPDPPPAGLDLLQSTT